MGWEVGPFMSPCGREMYCVSTCNLAAVAKKPLYDVSSSECNDPPDATVWRDLFLPSLFSLPLKKRLAFRMVLNKDYLGQQIQMWVPSPLAALCQNELGVVWYLKDNFLTVCCLICSSSDADDAGVADFPAVLFYFCGGTQMKIRIEKSWVGQSTNAGVIQTLSAPSSGQASVIRGLRRALHSRVHQPICSWYPDTCQLGNQTSPAGKRGPLPAEWGLV